jgi:hypothetical protein
MMLLLLMLMLINKAIALSFLQLMLEVPNICISSFKTLWQSVIFAKDQISSLQ